MFQSKVVVITGAAGGIGSATAAAFAAARAKVVLLDRDSDQVQAVAGQLRAAGAATLAFAVDVTDADACAAALAKGTAAFGPVDVLVNNAGLHLREKIGDAGLAQSVRRTFDVNVFGMLNMTLAALDGLRQTRGAVVNLASIGSYVTAHTGLSYGPSKAAVKLFTQSMAQQLAPDGIRVNAVAPGPVTTPMTALTRANAQASARLLSRVPLSRYADPAEIAAPILFLASNGASYITGAILPVDGGFLAV